MRQLVKTTVLGEVIVIHPEHNGCGWVVICANKLGNWKSTSCHKDKAAAQQERTRLFCLHRQIAQEEVR